MERVYKTLYRTGCKVMGRKVAGSSFEPFLYARTVIPCFQTVGKSPLFHDADIILQR